MQSDSTRAWSPNSAKFAFSLATASIRIAWLLLATWLVLMVVVFAGVFSGKLPTQTRMSTMTIHMFLGCVALFAFCGSLKSRCENLPGNPGMPSPNSIATRPRIHSEERRVRDSSSAGQSTDLMFGAVVSAW